MLTSRTEELAGGRARRILIDLDSSPLSYGEALRRWQQDPSFRSFFIGVLASAPFAAFRWETPPITASTVGRAFEFVLLDSPGLATRPDPGAFAEHFHDAAIGDVVTFPNLGNDAVLVAPCPRSQDLFAYGHLAAFVRQAPELQKHALWTTVGDATASRLGSVPIWLSTAGAGVPWLHVRLDSSPKYYGHRPYL